MIKFIHIFLKCLLSFNKSQQISLITSLFSLVIIPIIKFFINILKRILKKSIYSFFLRFIPDYIIFCELLCQYVFWSLIFNCAIDNKLQFLDKIIILSTTVICAYLISFILSNMIVSMIKDNKSLLTENPKLINNFIKINNSPAIKLKDSYLIFESVQDLKKFKYKDFTNSLQYKEIQSNNACVTHIISPNSKFYSMYDKLNQYEMFFTKDFTKHFLCFTALPLLIMLIIYWLFYKIISGTFLCFEKFKNWLHNHRLISLLFKIIIVVLVFYIAIEFVFSILDLYVQFTSIFG